MCWGRDQRPPVPDNIFKFIFLYEIALLFKFSSRLHRATRLLFVTNWTWRYNVHPSLLRMLFLFGWPPCQRSDMTLVEVSQHAYDYLYIRTIVLFVFLRNSSKPDMVLVYILLNKLCLSLSLSLSLICNYLSMMGSKLNHVISAGLANVKEPMGLSKQLRICNMFLCPTVADL